MIPYCRHEALEMVPWSPIARGFLAGVKPCDGGSKNSRAEKDRVLNSYFDSDDDYCVLDAVEAAARKYGVQPAQIAHAWMYSKDYATAPIVGAETVSHLDEAIDAVSLKLDKETLATLEAPYRLRKEIGEILVAGRSPI